jgi:hypothetical protein
VIYADGTSWSNLDALPAEIDERPSGPVVVMRSGGGDRGSWAMNAWLWPLPPDGPLTFVAEWPKYRITECRADVDGGRVRAAASRAEQLWTIDDNTAL